MLPPTAFQEAVCREHQRQLDVAIAESDDPEIAFRAKWHREQTATGSCASCVRRAEQLWTTYHRILAERAQMIPPPRYAWLRRWRQP